MTKTVEAVYEAGILRLLEPVDLLEGTHLTVTLQDASRDKWPDAASLLALPRAERDHILAAAAEAAAPIYEADLDLPASERDLTAFTALDGEPVLENQTDFNKEPHSIE